MKGTYLASQVRFSLTLFIKYRAVLSFGVCGLNSYIHTYITFIKVSCRSSAYWHTLSDDTETEAIEQFWKVICDEFITEVEFRWIETVTIQMKSIVHYFMLVKVIWNSIVRNETQHQMRATGNSVYHEKVGSTAWIWEWNLWPFKRRVLRRTRNS